MADDATGPVVVMPPLTPMPPAAAEVMSQVAGEMRVEFKVYTGGFVGVTFRGPPADGAVFDCRGFEQFVLQAEQTLETARYVREHPTSVP